MRTTLSILLVLAAGLICVAACGDGPQPGEHKTSQPWSIGYWLWAMSESPYVDSPGGRGADLMYVLVGSCKGGCGSLYLQWPAKVPKAAEYLAVLRIDGTTLPAPGSIPELVQSYGSLRRSAAAAGQKLVGVQIDFDSPTAHLDEYAGYLADVRRSLPSDARLSITALLDWFSPNSEVDKVVAAVDEYVPQFYDVFAREERTRETGIAVAIDAPRWSAIFNSFKRPYRVGIASFGRITEFTGDPGSSSGGDAHGKTIKEEFYRYSSLAEILRDDNLEVLGESKSKADESIVLFRRRSSEEGCPQSGRTVKAVFPTGESVLSAYRAAKEMGGSCRGVVLYRWPAKTETMVLNPEEIARVIKGEGVAGGLSIEQRDGFCADVSCADLYVQLVQRFPREPVNLRVRSSGDLEYFVPARSMTGDQEGAKAVRVRIPAFSGESRIYLGRAVTRVPVEFSVEPLP